jgi:hypothetical protein
MCFSYRESTIDDMTMMLMTTMMMMMMMMMRWIPDAGEGQARSLALAAARAAAAQVTPGQRDRAIAEAAAMVLPRPPFPTLSCLPTQSSGPCPVARMRDFAQCPP